MAVTQVVFTPDDLLTLPAPANGRHYELSDGKLICVGNAGWRHERIKGRIVTALVQWLGDSFEWRIFSETQFRLDERTVRIPNVSVVRRYKIASIREEDVVPPFAPDIAVEVVSLSEAELDAEKKVAEYLSAGVGEVWQVFPVQNTVRVRRVGEDCILQADDLLRSVILPSFQAPVSSFFSD